MLNNLAKLQEVTKKIKQIKDDLEQNTQAQVALDRGYTIAEQLKDEEYQLEHMQDVWDAVKKIWHRIMEINKQPFKMYRQNELTDAIADSIKDVEKIEGRPEYDHNVFKVYVKHL